MLNLTFYGTDDSYENFPQQEELHVKIMEEQNAFKFHKTEV